MHGAARDHGLDGTAEPPARDTAGPAAVIAEACAVIARCQPGPAAAPLLDRLAAVGALAAENGAALSAAYARGYADGKASVPPPRRFLRAVPAQRRR